MVIFSAEFCGEFFVEKFKMAPPAFLLGKKYEFSSCSSHCVTVNNPWTLEKNRANKIRNEYSLEKEGNVISCKRAVFLLARLRIYQY